MLAGNVIIKTNAFQHFLLVLVIICVGSQVQQWRSTTVGSIKKCSAKTDTAGIHANNALIFSDHQLHPLCCACCGSAAFVVYPGFCGYVQSCSWLAKDLHYCHLVLGVGFDLARSGAFLAVTGRFTLLPSLFSFAGIVFYQPVGMAIYILLGRGIVRTINSILFRLHWVK